jgi:6-phospho-beta-glucosidase
MKRGGAYYSTLATQLLNAHYNDLDEVHVVNVPNRGRARHAPADWVMELPCRVARSGITPAPVAPLHPAVAGLVAAVKAYELLTVEAAVHGDRDAAYQALIANPIGTGDGAGRCAARRDADDQPAFSAAVLRRRLDRWQLKIERG